MTLPAPHLHQAAQRAAIQAEAWPWLRTPYHHMADVRGSGVDCLMLLVRVFAAAGHIPSGTDPRPYSAQWHQHRGEEVYLAGLEQHAVPLPAGQRAGVGDVRVWRFGRTFSHAGILVKPEGGAELLVLHALADAGEVTLQRLTDAPLAGRDSRTFTLFPET